MALIVDSEMEFFRRVEELGMGAYIQKFRDLDLKTHGAFAFCVPHTPGQQDEKMFFEKVVTPIIGAVDAVLGHMLRRLFYESYMLVSADASRRVEGLSKPDDTPARMPPAEREHRRLLLAQRLVGLDIDGELDPSHKLLDAAYDLFEKNVVRYIEWQDCTKRESELCGVRQERVWKPDASGTIKEQVVSVAGTADLSCSLRLRNALLRRGLALDIAGVCSYETHTLWVDALAETLRDPPPGYAKVTMDQIHRADHIMWTEVARECMSGVRATLGEQRPFDIALRNLIFDPRIRTYMAPLPAGTSRPAPALPNVPERLSKKQRKEAQRQKQLQLQLRLPRRLRRPSLFRTPRRGSSRRARPRGSPWGGSAPRHSRARRRGGRASLSAGTTIPRDATRRRTEASARTACMSAASRIAGRPTLSELIVEGVRRPRRLGLRRGL